MPGAVDIAVKVGAALIPPPPGSSEERVYHWHLAVSAALGGVIVMMGLHIALACGFITVFGFTGFAQASELQSTQAQIIAVQSNQLDAKIIDTRERQCDATKVQNEDAKRFASERLNDELRKYYQVTHQWYRVPTCDQL